MGSYPPRNPPIGFLVPRMYEDAGGGDEETTTGVFAWFGVVTIAFVRLMMLIRFFNVKRRVKRKLTVLARRDDILDHGLGGDGVSGLNRLSNPRA